MVEMVIDSIRASALNYQPVMILKEKAAECYLPIWINPAEANAIAVKIQGATVPRPLSHDLLHSVIVALGATLNSIVINDLESNTFYAKIILNTVDGEQLEVDSRPSDAVALALRAEVPIYVDEAVLDKAGISLDKKTVEPRPREDETDGAGSQNEGVVNKESRGTSAFTDFINTLDLSDFEERKS